MVGPGISIPVEVVENRSHRNIRQDYFISNQRSIVGNFTKCSVTSQVQLASGYGIAVVAIDSNQDG